MLLLLLLLLKEWERRGVLEFLVFQFWPLFRSIFRFLHWKTLVFRFCCPLRFLGFSFLASDFSAFGNNKAVFRILVTDVVLGFSNLKGSQRQTCFAINFFLDILPLGDMFNEKQWSLVTLILIKGFARLRKVPKLLFLGQDWARKVCRFSALFGYLTRWEPN